MELEIPDGAMMEEHDKVVLTEQIEGLRARIDKLVVNKVELEQTCEALFGANAALDEKLEKVIEQRDRLIKEIKEYYNRTGDIVDSRDYFKGFIAEIEEEK